MSTRRPKKGLLEAPDASAGRKVGASPKKSPQMARSGSQRSNTGANAQGSPKLSRGSPRGSRRRMANTGAQSSLRDEGVNMHTAPASLKWLMDTDKFKVRRNLSIALRSR